MKRWVKRLGCCAGIFFLFLLILFGIVVFLVMRQQRTTPPVATPAQRFTEVRVALPATPSQAPIPTDDDPSIGPTDARVTVVEFSDFECPFCRQAFPIVRELMVKYGDRVRFVYRDFPVRAIHDHAQKAAEAGACADAQGKFWALHDKIFQSVPAITVPDVKRYAQEVGLDTSKFNTCIDAGQFAAEVERDLADGIALGVRGTPTWFINGHKIEGVIPRETFIQILDQLLATSTP